MYMSCMQNFAPFAVKQKNLAAGHVTDMDSTHHRKDIRASSYLFTWRVDNVISRDHNDKIALMDLCIWHHHDLYEF